MIAKLFRATSLLAIALTAHTASAALVIYEGFDTALADGGSFNGTAGAAGSSSIGFDAGGWNTGTYQAAGLSFGSLSTTGGNMHVTGDDWTQSRSLRGLNVTATGTVWGSFLFQRTAHSSMGQDTAGIYIHDFPSDLDTYAFANIYIDGSTGTNPDGLGQVRGRNNKPDYAGRTTGINNSGVAISSNTTYMSLFKITNVGGTSGAVEVSQWILTEAQFNQFKSGGITETELNSAATGSGSSDVLQRANMNYTPLSAAAGFYPRITGADTFAFWRADAIHVKYDEIRLSNLSLDEVTPAAVPEPSAIGLALLGIAGMAVGIARRQRGQRPPSASEG